MKKPTLACKIFASGLLIFAALPVTASSILDDLFPYAGIDYERTYMKGNHTFRKHLPVSYQGGNFYVGTRLFDVAAEFGYDFTAKHHKHSKLYKTRVRTDSWHVDLNGYLPLFLGIDLLGTIGMASTKASIGIRVREAQKDLLEVSAIQANRKHILRVGAGLEYIFEECDCIGVRGIIRWKNTEKFRLRGNTVNQENGFTNKPCEDAVVVTIGVFTYF